jgi:hypothetical protein
MKTVRLSVSTLKGWEGYVLFKNDTLTFFTDERQANAAANPAGSRKGR